MHPDTSYSHDVWPEKPRTTSASSKLPHDPDDALLGVAHQLHSALAPLRHMDSASFLHQQHLLERLRSRHTLIARRPRPHHARLSLLVATVLALLLIVDLGGVGSLAALWSGVTHVWHASTSLDQLQGISVAALERPRAGIQPLPLLPTTLPGDTQASSYGVITDKANPNTLAVFVADYRIAGQDVFLYEQPAGTPYVSTAATTIAIGSIQGQFFQDTTGNAALQWYQHGMLCQITSKLPVHRLLALATLFQPITNWNLILA